VSVAVTLEELDEAVGRYSWCYVITVGDSGAAHLSAVTPTLDDGIFTADVGRTSVANASARTHVVLVFPPPDHSGMSLIVDTQFESGDPFRLRATSAVLHRAAPA
jgi:hypothetical protein